MSIAASVVRAEIRDGIESHTELKSALALAVPVKAFNGHKTDIDTLREFALWEEKANSNLIIGVTPGRPSVPPWQISSE
jgi:hypothetical protein